MLEEIKEQIQPHADTIAIAFRFRTSFNYEIFSKNLDSNPDLSADTLRAAVNVDSPSILLPSPWPPETGNNLTVVERNALIKMKYIVGRASDLLSFDAVGIKRQLIRRSPDVEAIGRQNPLVVQAEVLLRVDGVVNYNIQFPTQLDDSNTLFHVHSGDGKDYVNDMILLAIQREYEQKGGQSLRFSFKTPL